MVYVIKRAGTITELSSMLTSKKKRIKSVMILGGGKIGFKLARILESYKKNSLRIKIVEKSSEKCRVLSEYLNKTLVLNGDAADINFLKDEDIENTDMLVSVTGSDELNILTSILGKKLGVSNTIVEINKPDYEVLMQPLGIDSFISPRLLVAGRLSKLFRRSSIISETFLKDGRAEIIELIVSKDSPLIHQQLKKLRLSAKGIIVGGILRQEKAIIPRGDDRILPGDHLIVFTQPQHVKLVERLLCSDKPVVSYKGMVSS